MTRKIPAFIEDERATAEPGCQEPGFPIRLPHRSVEELYSFRGMVSTPRRQIKESRGGLHVVPGLGNQRRAHAWLVPTGTAVISVESSGCESSVCVHHVILNAVDDSYSHITHGHRPCERKAVPSDLLMRDLPSSPFVQASPERPEVGSAMLFEWVHARQHFLPPFVYCLRRVRACCPRIPRSCSSP